MNLFITDPGISKRMIRRRQALGIDRKDEVWEGVYVVSPLANDEHQELVDSIFYALQTSVKFAGLGIVRSGANITDRLEKWTKNFRVPDVAVFLEGTTAIKKKTHWVGGPDFAVEVISRYDRSREKLDFYAKLGVKELLLVDRKPWAIELYRLQDGVLTLAGKSDLVDPAVLTSQVVPLSFQLVAGEPRPTLLMTHSDGIQRWSA